MGSARVAAGRLGISFAAMIARMSNGPVIPSSRTAPSSAQIIGVVLLAQAALRAYFIAPFMLRLWQGPRLSQAIFGNIFIAATAVVLPAALVVGGIVAGLMLLGRLSVAAGVAGAFCILGLLFQASGMLQVASMYFFTSHHPPTHTYVLMVLNTAIYLGCLITLSRSA